MRKEEKLDRCTKKGIMREKRRDQERKDREGKVIKQKRRGNDEDDKVQYDN